MSNIYVYRLTEIPDSSNCDLSEINIIKWRPSFTRVIPPNSPIAYFYFWLMHYLKIFKNDNYCAYVIYDKNKPVSSLVCVPSLYRWSFMKSRDIQIKNVFTVGEYRGKGYAFLLVNHAISDIGIYKKSFWYMTNEENIPSQNLCKKIGFKYMGLYGRRRSKSFFLKGEVL